MSKPTIVIRYNYVPTQEQMEEIKKQFISIDDYHVIFLFGEDQPFIDKVKNWELSINRDRKIDEILKK